MNAKATIIKHHYTHSFPSGKSKIYEFECAIVVFSIPANPYIKPKLGLTRGQIWELTRLWAPDGHSPNLLTQAISVAVGKFRIDVPECSALISYADPNVNHHGGVYKAASWQFVGQSTETRRYKKGKQIKARRAFHSGNRALRKAEIEALGWKECKGKGKLLFIRPLSREAKRIWKPDV